ncbi:MAG: glycosyltransferase family 2 protein [Chloroflexales bacterium]
MNPSVSIIVVTYNSAAHIAAWSAALRAVRYAPTPQIVVVDNASQDTSAALVRQLLPEALLLPQATNLGFSGGVQRGVAASSGEVLVLLNPDTVIDPGWLAALVAPLAEPRCGIVGSKILDPQGKTLLHAGGLLTQPVVLASHRGYDEPDRGQYETPMAVPFVTGASLALRRELWERLGGLDPGFFPGYFEDVDLCWRAQALGLACWYAPQSTLRHSESASTGKFSGTFYYYHHLNRLRFACKHLPWRTLWNEFAPAEGLRLRKASALDRAVAGLVYRQALPHGLAVPDAATQATILRHGRTLAALGAHLQDQPDAWPTEARTLLGLPTASLLPALLAQAEAEAVLAEHQFRSALPLVAALRRAWNNVATRWYVLPLLHQQTRFNLATQRSVVQVREQIDLYMQCTLLETQVRQALLCYQMALR